MSNMRKFRRIDCGFTFFSSAYGSHSSPHQILDQPFYNGHPNIKATAKAAVVANTIWSVKNMATGLPRNAQITKQVFGWESFSRWKNVNYLPKFKYGMAAIDLVDGLGEIFLCEYYGNCRIDEQIQ